MIAIDSFYQYSSSVSDDIVKVSHISKKFGNICVLQDISLNIRQGEVVCIIGPSGCGKTTFLRCLNGLEDITAGEIFIDGVNIHGKNVNIDQLRTKIGMVSQNYNLFRHMTVINNVTFAPLELKTDNRIAIQEYACHLLKNLNLLDKKDCYPHQLSGGQQQRVAIARTLAMKPHIMLFDEPTSSLDPQMVNDVIKVIQMLVQTGTTIIMVTHEMGFAREVANRIVFMAEGVIIEQGHPSSFFSHPKSEKTKLFLKYVL